MKEKVLKAKNKEIIGVEKKVRLGRHQGHWLTFGLLFLMIPYWITNNYLIIGILSGFGGALFGIWLDRVLLFSDGRYIRK